MKKFLVFIINFILLFTNYAIFYSCNATYLSIPTWNDTSDTTEVSAETTTDFLNIESESAILIEQTTGKILYEKNSHEQLRPASVTKLMSILLVMEALDSGKISLSDKVPCSAKAAAMGGSQIWLDETETLTVDEMLKAVCTVSANDCIYALSEFISGSEEAFVEKMNERAKELGMNDTCFKNCHGIDEDGHVSSSYDIALMSRELLQNHPLIINYTTIWMDTLRDGESELVNTNKLIHTYEGATGLKTGSTSLALYNLSASATRGDLSLIAVVMRAPTTKIRFDTAKTLLDYGFNNFEFSKIATKDSVLQSVSVNKGTVNSVDLSFENDSGVLLEKGDSSTIDQEITINENITAPISEGDVLGKVTFSKNGEIIGEVNLIAKDDVPKMNFKNMFNKVTTMWFSLLRNE
jgi:D-alanyl-D-alanine carboxypeptidase (penicillin-binding protein 5/6)